MRPLSLRLRSLSSEITLVFASLSVVLVILLTWIAYQMNARAVESRIREDLMLAVDQSLRGIDAEIEERVREVQTLSLTPTLREAARRATRGTESLGLEAADDDALTRALSLPGEDRLGSEATRFLSELQENHPAIAGILLTDRYGIPLTPFTPSKPGEAFRQKSSTWWQETVTQRYYLGNLENQPGSGGFVYSIAFPIRDDPRPPLGVVKASFNLKGVHEIARSVRIGESGYLVIISAEGRILSHPRPDAMFRLLGDLPDLVPVARLLSATPRGVFTFEQDAAFSNSREWMITFSRLTRPASLGPLNWTVAAFASRAELIGPLIAARYSAIAAGLVFMLASVPLVAAASRHMSRPLADLAHKADRIRQGELDVNLAIPSSNEIGTLANALSSMVEHLKAMNRRTLDVNSSLERTVRERTEELQRKNRLIELQNKKVLEANRLKSQFLANMSHELRTPLNAVLALSDILSSEMSGPLNEEQNRQVGIINRSGKSLLRLINDILDLSKIEAGRMGVERAPMSLHGLVTMLTDTLRPLAEDKKLSLSSTLAPGVPEFMNSDDQKLRQILINLIGNGVKFTEAGGVRMDVSHTADPAMITFRITDTGIGITPDSIDRIFEEFQQADGSTTRKYGGTGLGLTISKKMAELMAGTLTVESRPGEGSTFILSVPYEPAQPVAATATEMLRRVRMQVPEPALMSTTDDSATALRDPRPVVLVAEDEHDTLYIMKKYINKCGCQAIFARDGGEVLAKTRQFKPIAIVLDLVLPRKNGWDVLSELKSDPETRNIPVIVASVLDNQERGFCLGAYRYMVKPVSETDLTDTIHQIKAAGRKDVRRVLVIDDNMVDADLLERILTENKYDVTYAGTGEEGIILASAERPDLIMLDLCMPTMDGFAVLDRLRSRDETRDIPVIIYTARDLSTAEREGLRTTASKVLMKNPLDPARMIEEIGALLQGLPRGEDAARPTTPDIGVLIGGLRPLEVRPRASTAVAPQTPRKARVLIVEDDTANQYTLTFLLQSSGYEVLLAENGREGIDRVRKDKPDIVLMDVMMPVMGGHEATRVLKETPDLKDIPIIALTAAAMAGDREKSLAAGCDDYVSKPFNREQLLERTAHWIARARDARAAGKPLGSLRAQAEGKTVSG